MEKIKKLIGEKASLNTLKQQLEFMGIKNNENISKKIQEISEEINSLKSEESEILKDIIKPEVPEVDVISKIKQKLVDMEELPMGVYASFICILEKSRDYIIKHNQNLKDQWHD